nr:radical SAM mobile pair protein A [Clostridia bacterium]
MSVCIKDRIQNMNLVVGCTVGCTYCYARNNTRRFHIIDDFEKPEFFENKMRMMDRKKPQIFLLTGMSNLSGWKSEWRQKIFERIYANPQHQFVFLTKRPDLLNFETSLDNAWLGVTVTGKEDLWRIKALKENVKAKHYHVTFEPLFNDPGVVDFSGIDWTVIGTMTGAKSRSVKTEQQWAYSLTSQAKELNIPVFWKEDLVPIMGEDAMIQEFPVAFNAVLEEQDKWNKKK